MRGNDERQAEKMDVVVKVPASARVDVMEWNLPLPATPHRVEDQGIELKTSFLVDFAS